MKEQKIEKVKLVKVKEVKEQKVEKILNKRKIGRIVKYLVRQKGFTVKHDSQKRKEKWKAVKKKDFRREKLPEKHTAKMLYRWNDGKFKNEYLKRLEKNWQKWKSVSPKKKP